MEIVIVFFLFTMGLCLGSFVNMLVYRVERVYGLVIDRQKKQINTSLVLGVFGGRSYCDYCKKQLNWYENIPIFSWILLGGKTRCCGKKLSGQYPLVELGMGVLLIFNFQYSIFKNNDNFLLLSISSLILVFMVFSFIFDLKHMILPDFSTGILFILGIVYVFLFNHIDWKNYLFGGFLGLGIIGGLYWITKGKAMGFGDVKLAVFMGIFLGVKNLIVAMYVAFVAGAIVGVYLLIRGKKSPGSPIPFGPFLLLGTLVGWWFGAKIWYEAWLYFG